MLGKNEDYPSAMIIVMVVVPPRKTQRGVSECKSHFRRSRRDSKVKNDRRK